MTDSNVWKEKDIRIARQSATKASVNLLDIAERLGVLDSTINSFEELYTLNCELSDKIFERIYMGMSK